MGLNSRIIHGFFKILLYSIIIIRFIIGISLLKELASFAKGLNRDIDAVENAVASPLNNGFVEGTNSKLKTIKKAMYGRCGIKLLSAKLMYDEST